MGEVTNCCHGQGSVLRCSGFTGAKSATIAEKCLDHVNFLDELLNFPPGIDFNSLSIPHIGE